MGALLQRVNPSVRAFLAIACILLSNVIAAPAQNSPITVMTFNIRFDNPADGINSWDNRKELTANKLQEISPDLLGMQEVLERQCIFLKDNLPGYDYRGAGRDDGKTGGEYSPVFFRTDRFSIVDWGTFWLSPTPEDTGSVGWDAALTRICTWMELQERSSGFEFYFLNTHFDHMGDTARAESAKLILDFINKETKGLPVILTGDFNCSPEEEPYRVFTAKPAGLTDACTVAGSKADFSEGTFNGFGLEQNPERIDMVFYKGRWKANSYDVLQIKDGGMFISDHWPVVVQLENK